jgi:hypothetical protein
MRKQYVAKVRRQAHKEEDVQPVGIKNKDAGVGKGGQEKGSPFTEPSEKVGTRALLMGGSGRG